MSDKTSTHTISPFRPMLIVILQYSQ